MVSRGSSAEDISHWLTPRRALEILEASFPDKHSALNELKERLRGGILVAACYTTSIDGNVLKAGILNRVGSDDWDRVYSDNDVWATGTLTIAGGYRTSSYETAKTIRFFDVRFNPADIEAIVALHKVPHSPADVQQETEKPSETDAKKPAVSEAHLKAWCELYLSVYRGTPADTLPNALASARGMFPDRFVSRDRVRHLVGGRTPGRRKNH